MNAHQFARKVFDASIPRMILLLLADTTIVAVSYLASQWIRLDFMEGHADSLPPHWVWILVILIAIRLVCGLLSHHYTWSFRHSSIPEALSVFKTTLAGTILFILVFHGLRLIQPGPPRAIYPMEFLFTLFGFLAIRFAPRTLHHAYLNHLGARREGGGEHLQTLIVGADHEGAMILRDLLLTNVYPYHVVGFVDDTPSRRKVSIHGRRVLGTCADLPDLIRKHGIDKLLIADPAVTGTRLRALVDICSSCHVRYKVIPPYADVVRENIATPMTLRDIELEDLLDRKPVRFDHGVMADFFAGKVALVTGAAGSIGGEICRQLVRQGVRRLVALDVNENDLYFLHMDLQEMQADCAYHLEIASVRDEAAVERVFRTHAPQIVFHAAAHKHVPLMEYCPVEALKNNVLGTMVVADAAHRYGAEGFVFISTDKAVRPTNVMGASKALGEMIVRDLGASTPGTMYMAVRFGNVLGSSGSLVPILKRQIAHGGPVTVTHPNITRYFMTIPEAVGLVLVAAAQHEGATCVLDMGEPLSIDRLARSMIALAGLVPDKDIPIQYTGLRPGEKMFEELFAEGEELQPSTHPRIRLARCVQSPETVAGMRRELPEVIADGTPERVRAFCARYVEGYSAEA